MFGWFKSSAKTKARDAKRLYKDALTIIQIDRQTCSAQYMQRVADLAREEFARIEQRLAQRPKDRAVIRYDVQQQHRNARRRHDYAQFTAMTLVLIHMQASALAEEGTAAIEVIEHFLDDPLDNANSDSDTNDDTHNTTNKKGDASKSNNHLSA